MDTTLHASPPRRDKREDHATWRQGVAGRATCTHQTKQLTHASPISPAIASQGDSCAELCCAALCALLCCAVMWLLHPLSASPVFQRGGPPWPPILFLTSHSIFSLLRRSSLPSLLACPSLPAWVPAWMCPSRTDRAGKCEPLPLAVQQMSSFNNGRLSEKRPANRDPQYPSPLPAAGRA